MPGAFSVYVRKHLVGSGTLASIQHCFPLASASPTDGVAWDGARSPIQSATAVLFTSTSLDSDG